MAGTLTVTSARVASGVSRFTFTWTSDGSGVVSGNAAAVKAGRLLQAVFIPNGGGTQPTDLYDVTLVDSNGVDYLCGQGANLSNAAASLKAPTVGSGEVAFWAGGNLDLRVANAGAAKGGVVQLDVLG